MTKQKLLSYLAWAFAIAWLLQIVAAQFYRQGNIMAYQMILMLSMFAPLFAAILSKSGIRALGWKPHVKKNLRVILCAWFLPALLGIIGAGVYFLVFPNAFDTTFRYLLSQIGQAGLDQMEAQGLTLPMYIVINFFFSITFAPIVNMIPAVGEEVGWRGVMTPALKQRFGSVKGSLLSGIIWGAWHWPIMVLCGYEYGTGYWGEPITGMIIFCINTTSLGILLDWLYERSGCIWVPALCHGAINAFAALPMLFADPTYSRLLGPAMNGLIAGLPLIAVAVTIMVRQKRLEK